MSDDPHSSKTTSHVGSGSGGTPLPVADGSGRGATDILAADLDEAGREECGVVGISGVENASELAFLCLYALQHRGQESAGICSVDGGRARMHKETGLVSDVFDAESLNRLEGDTALGHVRYSTAGDGGTVNAQPILTRYHEGDLAISHNGNLTNHQDLRNRLVSEGALFQSSSDSEVIVHLVARSRHETVDAQIDDALTHLEGAFSLVLMVGDTLYYGQGAGQEATASAVLSDVADAALDQKWGTKNRIPPFVPHERDGSVLPMDKFPLIMGKVIFGPSN
jgi:hypothetical protein